VPLGTGFLEIEDEVVRQAVAICEGNKHRAARKLDVSIGRVNRVLKRLARSENLATTEQAVGARANPSPGGQEVENRD